MCLSTEGRDGWSPGHVFPLSPFCPVRDQIVFFINIEATVPAESACSFPVAPWGKRKWVSKRVSVSLPNPYGEI